MLLATCPSEQLSLCDTRGCSAVAWGAYKGDLPALQRPGADKGASVFGGCWTTTTPSSAWWTTRSAWLSILNATANKLNKILLKRLVMGRMTPLHRAAQGQQDSVIMFLLERGLVSEDVGLDRLEI